MSDVEKQNIFPPARCQTVYRRSSNCNIGKVQKNIAGVFFVRPGLRWGGGN